MMVGSNIFLKRTIFGEKLRIGKKNEFYHFSLVESSDSFHMKLSRSGNLVWFITYFYETEVLFKLVEPARGTTVYASGSVEIIPRLTNPLSTAIPIFPTEYCTYSSIVSCFRQFVSPTCFYFLLSPLKISASLSIACLSITAFLLAIDK